MAGDINLFLNRDNDEPNRGELSIMIAEKCSQRKGLAQEAVLLMMKYGIQKFKLTSFIAKISTHNSPSIKLFEEKLGFTKVRNHNYESIDYHYESNSIPIAL